jgi:hypothetical protein
VRFVRFVRFIDLKICLFSIIEMAETNQVITPSDQESKPQEKKTRVIIGLPGDHFSQAFLLSWTQALHILISSNRYDIIVSPGKSSFVSFARMQTLGLDVRRGKNQKPFNGENYDIFVSIDSDVVFSASQLIELIECTKLHPVVSGYYMMSNNKQFAVVKDWNKVPFSSSSPRIPRRPLRSSQTSSRSVVWPRSRRRI